MVSAPDAEEDSTRPPLLATPGGVCNAHELVAVGRRNTSQNVLLGSCKWPMAIRTEDPDGVVVDTLIAAGGLTVAARRKVPPALREVVSAITAAAATVGSIAQRLMSA